MSEPTGLRLQLASTADTARMAALALGAGIVSGYAALGFLALIQAVEVVAFGGRVVSGSGSPVAAWRLALVPVLGGIAVGLLIRYGLPARRPQGPAEVIAAVRAGGRLPISHGFLVAAASILSIGTGASVGRYGPAVHLGATLGAALGRLGRLDGQARNALLAGGVAAAIAASFHAPLAGVLFAHEVVLGSFAVRAVMPIVIASAAGAGVARVHQDLQPLFALPDVGIEHVHEYPLFLVVGLAGGMLAVLTMRGLALAAGAAERSPLSPWVRPAVGGFGVGLIALWFPQVLGLGEETVQAVLHAELPVGLALALLAAKLVATSLSLGFGFAGGVLGPAMFLGAMLGFACGALAGELLPAATSESAVYCVAGLGAVVSRVVGAPIATILIVFELTSSYTMTTGAMIAVVVANLVQSRMFPGSYFEWQLTHLERPGQGCAASPTSPPPGGPGRAPRGGPAPQAGPARAGPEPAAPRPDRSEAGRRPASSVLPVAAVLETMAERGEAEVLLVDEGGIAQGRVRLADPRAASGRGAEPGIAWVDRSVVVVDDRVSIAEVLDSARRQGRTTVAVIQVGEARPRVGIIEVKRALDSDGEIPPHGDPKDAGSRENSRGEGDGDR